MNILFSKSLWRGGTSASVDMLLTSCYPEVRCVSCWNCTQTYQQKHWYLGWERFVQTHAFGIRMLLDHGWTCGAVTFRILSPKLISIPSPAQSQIILYIILGSQIGAIRSSSIFQEIAKIESGEWTLAFRDPEGGGLGKSTKKCRERLFRIEGFIWFGGISEGPWGPGKFSGSKCWLLDMCWR